MGIGKGGNKGKGMGAHTRSYWSGDRWPFFSAPEAEASRIENPQWKSSVGGDRRAARRSHAGFLGRHAGPGGMTCHGPDVCWEAPLPLPI
jgi:hypothetical protein